MAQDEIDQAVGQGPQRPAAARGDAVIAGGMAGSQPAGGAEQVGDRTASGGENGPAHQSEQARGHQQHASPGDRAQQWQSGFG